jgi:hypothetical protein
LSFETTTADARSTLFIIYCEEEPEQRSAAKLLSKDEARRIAANVAKLPGAIAPHVT